MAVVTPIYNDMAVVTLVIKGEVLRGWHGIMPDFTSAGLLAGRIVGFHHRGYSGGELIELIEREEEWLIADWRDRRDGLRGILSLIWRRVRRFSP